MYYADWKDKNYISQVNVHMEFQDDLGCLRVSVKLRSELRKWLVE